MIRRAIADARDREADGRPLMVRLRLTGRTDLHDALIDGRDRLRDEVRAIAAALSETLWLEKVIVATSPEAEIAAAGPDELDALLAELALDDALTVELTGDLVEFLAKAPADLDQDLELMTEARAGRLAPVLTEAATALRARLGLGGAA
jgi:hypothetical protein